MGFRPCIDLHDGQVKQIVGGSLTDDRPEKLRTNFVASHPPAWYAELYRRDNLPGGHIIMLGPGNEAAATEALAAWPGGMQLGGGITADNASLWLDRGASHIVVTSWVFRQGQVDMDRLRCLRDVVGRQRLVLDLSCRLRDGVYYVVTDRWQRFTDCAVSPATMGLLASFCDEFLVHAVDVEGHCLGVDIQLLGLLAASTEVPVTYAGGVASAQDLALVEDAGRGRLHVTVGSALDIFGGTGLRYEEVVAWHRRLRPTVP
ncbi:MAG: phosphoribosylformimino-5-aminoimidazole carboxamide ribotide isomerase [Desulfobulbaceae bacterium A2]|nr:MAG: phosphoribosylformimino-5-aminoimidazole carboxamide ribotide isomerase [Desulfobulbaceae bacterium A2]